MYLDIGNFIFHWTFLFQRAKCHAKIPFFLLQPYPLIDIWSSWHANIYIWILIHASPNHLAFKSAIDNQRNIHEWHISHKVISLICIKIASRILIFQDGWSTIYACTWTLQIMRILMMRRRRFVVCQCSQLSFFPTWRGADRYHTSLSLLYVRSCWKPHNRPESALYACNHRRRRCIEQQVGTRRDDMHGADQAGV